MKKAFTLIELLVVVLIIGILSAVALPQYQAAVMKTRSVRLLPLLRAIDNAEHVYYLANGTYTPFFDELDIGMPEGAKVTEPGRITYEQFSCNLGFRGSSFSTYCSDTDEKAPLFEKYVHMQNFVCWGQRSELATKICKNLCGVTELEDMGGGYIGCFFQ